MAHPLFCANGGSPLSSQIRFCESCGYPISFPLEPSPLPDLTPTKVPSTCPTARIVLPRKNSFFSWLLLALIVSCVAGLGLIGWFVPTLWRQWVSQSPPDPLVGTPPTPSVTVTAPNTVSLEDFVGSWMALIGDPDPDTEALTFRLEGVMIVADIDSDRLEVSVLNDRKLEGYLLQDGEHIPMSAELSQDKQQITFIVRPPYSEIQAAVAQRVSETSLDNQANTNGGLLTEEEALDRLISWPEIADWSQQITQNAPLNQAQFEIVETTPEWYLIRAYETVNNPGEPGHTATFGWYTINRQTGEVTSTLP